MAPAGIPEAGLKVRRLAPLLRAAISDELAAEGTPAHAALCKRADALQEQFDALAEEVWDQPVRSWADVVTRAEIVQAYGPTFSPSLDEQALEQLLEAVLEMGGRNV
jgi:hypothetical protein